MKKVVKVKGIVSSPLQQRYLDASEAERASLKPVVDQESQWMIDRMAAKGFHLEATVTDVLGIFTRGPATGAIKVLSQEVAGAPRPPAEEPAEEPVS